ncbi:MAG: flagellar hook assembly protein FlgD [Pseudomonadota bacterium]
MQINGLTSASASDPTSVASATKQSQDEFLRLFVAQLEHQDPLNPQDSTAFVAQLAQFSTLEQIVQTNTRLEAIEAEQATATGAALAGMLGESITATAAQFRASGVREAPPPLMVELDRPATSVTVSILDQAGTVVHRIDVPCRGQGPLAVPWDGCLTDGTPLPEGDYSISVSATDASGAEIGAHAVLQGQLEAIVFANGIPRLKFGSMLVTPGQVQAIGE